MAKGKTTPPAPKPWERQQDETPKPFEAFCLYRDMGANRSVRKVAAQLSKSDTLINRWSSKYKWVERAAEWDGEQDRINREIAQKEQAAAIREMRKRQAEAGKALQVKALKGLKMINEEELSALDIVRMLVEGSKIERIGRGDVGEVIEERDGGAATPAVQFYMPDNGRDQNVSEEEDSEE